MPRTSRTVCFFISSASLTRISTECNPKTILYPRQKELKLGNRVNIILDHQGENVALDLVEYISLLDRSSFPSFLKHLFIFDTDLKALLKNEEAKAILKSIDIHDKLLILPEKFEEPLYSKIQQTTAISEYQGDLDSPLFELDEILLDSIRMKLEGN